VLVTHDIDEALLLATRIVLIDQGKVVQLATPLELLTQPATAQVADFVGRSDMGIKWLSLQSAAGLARTQPALPGLTLAPQASLREAVSAMALHHVGSVNVVDAAGLHVGVLYAADVFAPEAGRP